MSAFLRISITMAALCLLVSCAQTGMPLPPSLELPKPPGDLRAARKGNTVTLTWSEPRLTTDRESVRYLGPTLVCRGVEKDMTSCGNPVASAPPPPGSPSRSRPKSKPSPAVPQTITDTLPASAISEDPEAELTYAVEVQNRNARGAGLSNRVHVPAIQTLPAPTDLSAEPMEDGVVLSWTSAGAPEARPGLQFRYRIYRREESSGKATMAGEVAVGAAGSARYLDSIEWEKTYLYWITAVSVIARPDGEVQVEGDDSGLVRVVAHDVFPPAVPVGLQAVFSGEGQKPFIDLVWSPVSSADLAGYNVFRSEANAAAVKVNQELVKTPSYRDESISSGKTYIYSVSAVDVRGNESAKSEEASETTP
jgi:hypothetical protein